MVLGRDVLLEEFRKNEIKFSIGTDAHNNYDIDNIKLAKDYIVEKNLKEIEF